MAKAAPLSHARTRSPVAGADGSRDGLFPKTWPRVPWLFTHLSGCYASTPRQDFRIAWAMAIKHSGLSGKLKHDFRRTTVRNMERAGLPRSVAMKITGQKTESVYRRYPIVSDADLQEATRKLMGTNAGT